MVYWPCATRSLVDELLLDFSLDADELPMDVDDALDADEVLSAQAGTATSDKASAAAEMRLAVNEGCMARGSVGGRSVGG